MARAVKKALAGDFEPIDRALSQEADSFGRAFKAMLDVRNYLYDNGIFFASSKLDMAIYELRSMVIEVEKVR